jgi:type VI protein secretion system component Hcp
MPTVVSPIRHKRRGSREGFRTPKLPGLQIEENAMSRKRDDQTATPDELAAGKGVEVKEDELKEVSGGGDPIPTEQVSFNYSKITWTYGTTDTTNTTLKTR